MVYFSRRFSRIPGPAFWAGDALVTGWCLGDAQFVETEVKQDPDQASEGGEMERREEV